MWMLLLLRLYFFVSFSFYFFFFSPSLLADVATHYRISTALFIDQIELYRNQIYFELENVCLPPILAYVSIFNSNFINHQCEIKQKKC